MRSICDIIPKLIITENPYGHESSNFNQDIPDFENLRNRFITNLFLKVNLTCSMETINNINNACIEILENKNILEFVISNEIILKHLLSNLSTNLNLEENSELSSYNYKEILILLLNIFRNSILENLYIPREENKPIEINEEETETNIKSVKSSFLGEITLEHLNGILDNFIIGDVPSSIFETTYSVSTRILGIKRYFKLIF